MGERIKRGEVRWYRFKPPDKRRPVLVLTRDSVMGVLGEVTVAPLTSTIRDIPSEVLLTPADGVSVPCAVNLDHVQTIARNKLGAVITTLSPLQMNKVRNALLFALGW